MITKQYIKEYTTKPRVYISRGTIFVMGEEHCGINLIDFKPECERIVFAEMGYCWGDINISCSGVKEILLPRLAGVSGSVNFMSEDVEMLVRFGRASDELILKISECEAYSEFGEFMNVHLDLGS